MMTWKMGNGPVPVARGNPVLPGVEPKEDWFRTSSKSVNAGPEGIQTLDKIVFSPAWREDYLVQGLDAFTWLLINSNGGRKRRSPCRLVLSATGELAIPVEPNVLSIRMKVLEISA